MLDLSECNESLWRLLECNVRSVWMQWEPMTFVTRKCVVGMRWGHTFLPLLECNVWSVRMRYEPIVVVTIQCVVCLGALLVYDRCHYKNYVCLNAIRVSSRYIDEMFWPSEILNGLQTYRRFNDVMFRYSEWL